MTPTILVRLLLAASLLLPLGTIAQGTRDKEVDLSILEEKDALTSHMTPAERIQFVRLETAIDEARSDLRSGQYLANAKPSTLDPDRDLKPTIERGKAIVEKAQAIIQTNQVELASLLKEVDARRTQDLIVEVDEYAVMLETVRLEEALTGQSGQLIEALEACWALGYETLFFENIFIQDSKSLHRAEARFRNQTYDALVELDGNRFTVKIPSDFQLKPDTRGTGRAIFSYGNAALFERDRKALLVFECIVPEGSSTGLFSLRAVDLDTQKIAVQKLVKIDDLSTLLPERPIDGLEDRIPDEARLRDPGQTIKRLSQLSESYFFQITGPTTDWIAASLLTQNLLQHSELELVDSAFVLRAYGNALDDPESWQGKANAELTLEPSDVDGSYQVKAQAENQERILDVGTLALGLEESMPGEVAIENEKK